MTQNEIHNFLQKFLDETKGEIHPDLENIKSTLAHVLMHITLSLSLKSHDNKGYYVTPGKIVDIFPAHVADIQIQALRSAVVALQKNIPDFKDEK
jgi:hypothetical protein